MASGNDERRRFVVGLGNPGRRYAKTRHNLGFRVVDALVDRWQAGRGKRAFDGRLYDAHAQRGRRQEHVLLLKPLTYMNRSGAAVGAMSAFYRADPKSILIILDDLALPKGRLRARASGTSGGHKGLDDVLAALDSQKVPRLRIGTGPAPPSLDSTDFVLERLPAAEAEIMDQAVQRASDAVEDWVFRGIRFVMDKYNGN